MHSLPSFPQGQNSPPSSSQLTHSIWQHGPAPTSYAPAGQTPSPYNSTSSPTCVPGQLAAAVSLLCLQLSHLLRTTTPKHFFHSHTHTLFHIHIHIQHTLTHFSTYIHTFNMVATIHYMHIYMCATNDLSSFSAHTHSHSHSLSVHHIATSSLSLGGYFFC